MCCFDRARYALRDLVKGTVVDVVVVAVFVPSTHYQCKVRGLKNKTLLLLLGIEVYIDIDVSLG